MGEVRSHGENTPVPLSNLVISAEHFISRTVKGLRQIQLKTIKGCKQKEEMNRNIEYDYIKVFIYKA